MVKNQATRFRITACERAALERAARQRGGTISDALRAAIRAQYVDPPDPPKMIEGHAVAIDGAGAPFGIQP